MNYEKVKSMDFDMSWIKSCLPKKHDYTWQKNFSVP